ncbi:hypothetical protein Goe21_00270 [Bacillus phage vB_BsuM-Goe21]|nr:hypothetical protein Goe21_00270 [Bacillus phage vB_BsuM-Goe21]
MADIKLVDKDTDLSNLKPIGWDLKINGVDFDVYRINGYNHSIGGKWGENCYWACPSNEKPTYENLIQFSGDAPTWGVTFDRINYVKTKWDETSVNANGNCWITRNGQKFYRINARYLDYGLATAQHVLVKLLEDCPLDLHMRNWKEKAIGYKIWYNNQPAKITDITSDNELWIVPDGISKFEAPKHYKDPEDYLDYEDGMLVDLLSPNIYWFRD